MLKVRKILLGALLSITTAPVQETYCVDGRSEEKHFKGEKNQKLSKIPVQEMIEKRNFLVLCSVSPGHPGAGDKLC